MKVLYLVYLDNKFFRGFCRRKDAVKCVSRYSLSKHRLLNMWYYSILDRQIFCELRNVLAVDLDFVTHFKTNISKIFHYG